MNIDRAVVEKALEFLGRVTSWRNGPIDLHDTKAALKAALVEQPAAPVVLTLGQIDEISNGVNGVQINGWPLSQRESRRLFAERILTAAVPPGFVVVKDEPVAWSVFDKRTKKHWYTHESQFTSQHYANEYSHQEGDGTPSMVVTPLYAARPGAKTP